MHAEDKSQDPKRDWEMTHPVHCDGPEEAAGTTAPRDGEGTDAA